MRQDIERQNELEPKRMIYSKNQIEKAGYKVDTLGLTKLTFTFKSETIHFFPYSGWHSGATIKDGRGINNLLKQLK
jgi:hypothetical protein